MARPRLHLSLLASAAAALLALNALPGAVSAQEEAEAEPSGVEEIVVTGSYIAQSTEDEALPVSVFSSDELQLRGSPTPLDMIKDLSFSQGADGETDQFQAGAGADRATVNLRGFGPSRSLVLLNGRRNAWSPIAIAAQAQLLVDLNTMPVAAVDRVEVLREGGAATYGSDAIGGVVNYITRSDFEGLEVSFNRKLVDGNGGDDDIGIIWGVRQGNMNLVTSFGFAKRRELTISERDWALRPFSENAVGGWSTVGRPAVFIPLDTWNTQTALASTVPLLANPFVRVLTAGITDPNCNDLGGARTNVIPTTNPNGGYCRFQFTAFDNLTEKAQRWQWFTELTLELSATTTFKLEYLKTNSNVPAWNTSVSYPPNRLIDPTRTIRAGNPALVDMASKYPDLYGDYASCTAPYCRYTGAATDEVAWFYGRAYGQDGPLRDHLRESNGHRVLALLEGEWRDYDWQSSFLWNRIRRRFEGGDTEVYRFRRAQLGLGGFGCEILVPNEYDANGNLAFSEATLAQHAGQGHCLYWSPFSNGMAGAHGQVLNGEARNPDFNPDFDNQRLFSYLVNQNYGLTGETTLTAWDFIVNGELGSWLELPGGEIGFAAGVQWRREDYTTSIYGRNDEEQFPCLAGPEQRDCTTGRTGLFGFLPPLLGIDGERDIYAVFGELSLPITKTLQGHISARFESYGGKIGNTLDPKVALRWKVLPWLGIRASAGTTFRAPTLNQTVSTNSSNSLQFVPVTGAFKRIDTRGNPNLEPETAFTWNAGLLIDRKKLLFDSDHLFVTVDYWSYDFEDSLVTEPFTDVLNAACPGAAAGSTDACAPNKDPNSPWFQRAVPFDITVSSAVEIINVDIINGPDIETSGVDLTLRYSMPAAGGVLGFGLQGTWVADYEIGETVLTEPYDAVGRLNYGTSYARSLVEFKGQAWLNYQIGGANLRFAANYLHDYEDRRSLTGVAPPPRTIERHITYDLHLVYRFPGEKTTLWASAINLTDEDPPFVALDMNYDAFTHNPFGSLWKVGFRQSF